MKIGPLHKHDNKRNTGLDEAYVRDVAGLTGWSKRDRQTEGGWEVYM